MPDRNYCVVGGSSGIGRALVARLRGDGASVLTLSRRSEVANPAGHHVWDATCDPFPEAATGKRCNGLVYLPGSIRLAPIGRLSARDFRDDFEINVVGAVKAVQAMLPDLRAAAESGEGAAIVLVSSVAARTGLGMHASIAVAKGAVEGLGRALAAELAPHVRVNVVAPSLTDTPMAGRLLTSDKQRDMAASRHPLRTIGTADDIAAAIEYLLGADSRFVTGQVLNVDGGLGALRG
ncbi:MAG: SDR family oxidoreductase [Chromatiales bacterium]|nr:SDR family oxidoreductase [Gammaproteobacteria bacterium]MCP5351695.1 SDR family oxidoreductase [Chromatiales bacterium]